MDPKQNTVPEVSQPTVPANGVGVGVSPVVPPAAPAAPVSPVVPPVNPVPSMPAGAGMESHVPPKSGKTTLYMAVIIIFIAAIIALGWLIYSYAQPMGQTGTTPVPTPTVVVNIPQPSPAVSAELDELGTISKMGSSDEVAEIEKDLSATDMTATEGDLESLKSEIAQ